MTADEYLEKILKNHEVSDSNKKILQNMRDNIQNDLIREIGSKPKFYYAGSYGKKTMISDSFDLDIVIYYPSDTRKTLKEIYLEVESALSRNNYISVRKNVAIRLNYKGGFHIDVVPGKAQDSSYNYATLYKSEENTTLQTSIKTHIENARRCREIIRLMKIWKFFWQNTTSSFALEQLVVYGLWKTPINSYADSMKKVLQYINDNVEKVKLEDPANTNNIIELSYTERKQLQTIAFSSINKINQYQWDQVVK